jgi:2-polyprenyl-6-methoxyphenol hydroxylase-like FAD-dependent oxidoreductase
VTNGKPFEVGIIGAGLGGLALAQSLVRLGIDVRVYERDTSPATRSQGYRITLDKRGIRALEACLPSNLWGLFQATLGEPGGFFRFVTGDLREIFHLDFAVKPGTDINYVASQADRTTLREILMCGLRDRIYFGKEAKNVDMGPQGTTVQFADGSSCTATVVVGADGARSQVRPFLLPDAQPVDLGSTAIYGRSYLDRSAPSLVPKTFDKSGVLAIGSPGKAFFFTTMTFRELPQDAFPRFVQGVCPAPQRYYLMWAICFPGAKHENLNQPDSGALLRIAKEEVRDFHSTFGKISSRGPSGRDPPCCASRLPAN